MKKIRNKHQLVQLMIKQQWTAEILAAKLEMTPRQIRRYVSGETPIPKSVELAINYVLEA